MLALRTKMRIKISQDFAFAPGPRKVHEGPHSGEVFRRDMLAPAVREAIETKQTLEVDLDGVAGYGRSFLEEAFGGLIREDHIPYESILAVITIISNEQPSQRERIFAYLKTAHEKESQRVVSST